jgi:actin related protein 2/3 complex, subunit 2
VFLDSQNAILKENLGKRILNKVREPCELKFSDFDNIQFKLSVQQDSPQIAKVSIACDAWSTLSKNGSQDLLNKHFSGMMADPEDGYNLAIEFDMDSIPEEDGNDFLNKVSDLKKWITGGPISSAFNALKNGNVTNTTIGRYDIRSNETIFVVPKKDRVVVILYLSFVDQTDKALSKVFLQEFAECKRAVSGVLVPNVSYSKDAPTELAGQSFPHVAESSGFILFQFEEKALSGEHSDSAMHLLTCFRSYLLYHIKASKTYLHMRMRKRVAGWLQVLNRAKPDRESKEKKSITGKTLSTSR